MLSSIKTSKLTLSNKEWTTMGRPISTKLELLGKHSINLLTKNKLLIISINLILPSLTNRSPNSLPPTNSRTIRSSSYINTMLFLRRIIFSQSKIWSPNGSRKGKKGKIKEKRREIEGKKLRKRRGRIKRIGKIEKDSQKWIQKEKKEKSNNGRPTTKNCRNKIKDYTNRLDYYKKIVKISSIKIKALSQQEEVPSVHL